MKNKHSKCSLSARHVVCSSIIRHSPAALLSVTMSTAVTLAPTSSFQLAGRAGTGTPGRKPSMDVGAERWRRWCCPAMVPSFAVWLWVWPWPAMVPGAVAARGSASRVAVWKERGAGSWGGGMRKWNSRPTRQVDGVK
jgi:hypothetical protein